VAYVVGLTTPGTITSFEEPTVNGGQVTWIANLLWDNETPDDACYQSRTHESQTC